MTIYRIVGVAVIMSAIVFTIRTLASRETAISFDPPGVALTGDVK
jgi:hypothetical protein